MSDDLRYERELTGERRRLWAAIIAMVCGILLVVTCALIVWSMQSRFAYTLRTSSGQPVRWNACHPIHYVVNSSGAGTSAQREVHRSLDAVSSASGLRFVFDGYTNERPSTERPAYINGQPAPVLIASCTHPRMKASDVMTIGRKRKRAASSAAAAASRPSRCF